MILKKPLTLITGASSGIGAEFARLAARQGHDLVLVARRLDRLHSLAMELTQHGTVCHCLEMDLEQPDAAQKLHALLQERQLEIEYLVNNAGFGTLGDLVDAPLEIQLGMLALNITTLTALTRLLLPTMKARGHGGVLNVGSTAGFQPGPHMAVYYATKAYVLSFSEALHEEMKPHGVSVSCLCPGPTQSEFADRANMGSTLLFRLGPRTSAQAALTGWQGFQKNQAVVIDGRLNQVLAFLVRLSPRALIRAITAKLQSTRR
jgi:short-subunit dehydrogenase